MSFREFATRLHRYAGLLMAVFLVIAGLTGSVIAFYHELDAWLNPDLYEVENSGPPLAPDQLAARVEQALPEAKVKFLSLRVPPGKSARLGIRPKINPATGEPYPLNYNQVFVHPATGAVLGMRQFGACCLERKHLLPFLYRLHYMLHLPGRWGWWLMGGIAIIWSFDCFIGAYLTLPRRAPFLARWNAAWLVRGSGNRYRLNYDLHRVFGLWPWLLLFLLAISSVYLNLKREVFRPVVSWFSTVTPSPYDLREERPSNQPQTPRLSFNDIVRMASTDANQRGFAPPAGVSYNNKYDIYQVRFYTLEDRHAGGLDFPRLYYDGQDGRLLWERIFSKGTTGDRLIDIQFPIHTGQIAGLPGRILISVIGIIVAMLSFTGVVIWWKKRTPQIKRRQIEGQERPSASLAK